MYLSSRKLLSLFLAAAMVMMFTLSGFAASSDPDLKASPSITYDIGAARPSLPVDFDEERVLAFNYSGQVTLPGFVRNPKEIAVVLDSSKKPGINPFDYALFSDDDMNIQGSNIDVTGNVHANGSIASNQSYLKVKGVMESVKTVTKSGYTSDTVIKEHVPRIDLPDFSFYIMNDPEMTRQIVVDHSGSSCVIHDTSLRSGEELCTNGVYISYDTASNTFKLTGNTVNLSTSKTVLYFKGNVTFTNGIKFTSDKQYIIADGNITIDGNVCSAQDSCIYSRAGNIRIDPSNSSIHGVVYAPKGTVTYSTTGNKVYGCVVAKTIDNATNSFTVVYQKGGVVDQVGYYVEQYYFGKAKDFIKQLLDQVRDDGVKMCIISYSGSANETNANSQNNFTLFDTNTEYDSILNALSCLNAGTDDKSNMGDGLRRAYYVLKNSGSNVPKYMFVLAFNNPNTWSAADSRGTLPLMDDGDSLYFGGTQGNMPIEYAKSVGNVIKNDTALKIKTIFACYSTEGSLSSLNEIAEETGAEEISAGSGNYYYQGNPKNLSSKLAGISMPFYSNARFKKITFTMTLPKNVEAVGYGSDTAGTRQTITQGIDLSDANLQLAVSDPYTGMNTYTFSGAPFLVKVHFLTPSEYSYGEYKGKVEFKGSDAKMNFTLDYNDATLSPSGPGKEFSSTFSFTGDKTYDLVHIVDIN